MLKRVFGHWRTAKADSKDPEQPTHPWFDLNRHCPPNDSLDTTECMNGEQRLGWYFAHARDELNLRMFEDTFSLDATYITIWWSTNFDNKFKFQQHIEHDEDIPFWNDVYSNGFQLSNEFICCRPYISCLCGFIWPCFTLSSTAIIAHTYVICLFMCSGYYFVSHSKYIKTKRFYNYLNISYMVETSQWMTFFCYSDKVCFSLAFSQYNLIWIASAY